MIQTREWQTGSDYSEIKELDQVPRYQNKTWHMASEADIYWLKCKKTFSLFTKYNSDLMQAFCLLKEYQCWQLWASTCLLGAQVTPCISPAKLYQTPQYRPTASTQTRFFERRHNSASSSSKWWHCCSLFDWHGCSRDAKHRRCSSSALISAANNLLPQWTEVPNATGTPSIHATGNSLNDLSFPVTQEITTLSHHHICLLIVGG